MSHKHGWMGRILAMVLALAMIVTSVPEAALTVRAAEAVENTEAVAEDTAEAAAETVSEPAGDVAAEVAEPEKEEEPAPADEAAAPEVEVAAEEAAGTETAPAAEVSVEEAAPVEETVEETAVSEESAKEELEVELPEVMVTGESMLNPVEMTIGTAATGTVRTGQDVYLKAQLERGSFYMMKVAKIEEGQTYSVAIETEDEDSELFFEWEKDLTPSATDDRLVILGDGESSDVYFHITGTATGAEPSKYSLTLYKADITYGFAAIEGEPYSALGQVKIEVAGADLSGKHLAGYLVYKKSSRNESYVFDSGVKSTSLSDVDPVYDGEKTSWTKIASADNKIVCLERYGTEIIFGLSDEPGSKDGSHEESKDTDKVFDKRNLAGLEIENTATLNGDNYEIAITARDGDNNAFTDAPKSQKLYYIVEGVSAGKFGGESSIVLSAEGSKLVIPKADIQYPGATYKVSLYIDGMIVSANVVIGEDPYEFNVTDNKMGSLGARLGFSIAKKDGAFVSDQVTVKVHYRPYRKGDMPDWWRPNKNKNKNDIDYDSAITVTLDGCAGKTMLTGSVDVPGVEGTLQPNTDYDFRFDVVPGSGSDPVFTKIVGKYKSKAIAEGDWTLECKPGTNSIAVTVTAKEDALTGRGVSLKNVWICYKGADEVGEEIYDEDEVVDYTDPYHPFGSVSFSSENLTQEVNITGLTPDKLYDIEVRYIDDDDREEPVRLAGKQVKTESDVDSRTVEDVGVSIKESNSLSLWAEYSGCSSDKTNYLIAFYRKKMPEGSEVSWSRLGDASTSGASGRVYISGNVSLSAGTEYEYIVILADTLGVMPSDDAVVSSASSNFTTDDIPMDDIPVSLSRISVSELINSVNFTCWMENAGDEGYYIYANVFWREKVEGETKPWNGPRYNDAWISSGNNKKNRIRVSLEGLSAATTYEYKVIIADGSVYDADATDGVIETRTGEFTTLPETRVLGCKCCGRDRFSYIYGILQRWY